MADRNQIIEQTLEVAEGITMNMDDDVKHLLAILSHLPPDLEFQRLLNHAENLDLLLEALYFELTTLAVSDEEDES